jgi:predicted transcriptional regulator
LTELQVDKETLQLLVKRRAMLRLLSILIKQKGNALPTRILLQKLGANNLHHVILQAEKEGYIKRERVKPHGKGNYPVYNHLTPKGRRLAELNKKLEC